MSSGNTTHRKTLGERIEERVREWPQWPPAELRRMDQIVEEVLQHCRDVAGNPFIAAWCDRNLCDLWRV